MTTIDNNITTRNNPLVETWNTPFGVPPFDEIVLSDYRPAVDALIDQGRGVIDEITVNSERATFQNTIVTLEFAQQPMERVLSVFYNLNSAETCDQMQALALELSPLLTDFSNDIMLNEALFERVRDVYNDAVAANYSDMNAEQRTLLDDTYKGFVRSGANLNSEQKLEYRTITTELSQLTLTFEQNLLAATNGYKLQVDSKEELAGLPESIRDAALADAKQAAAHGWVFTLHSPSFMPFMMYSARRELREQMYRAYSSRAFGGKHDNSPIVIRISELRLRLAQLLGYNSYSDYALEERMAQSSDKVTALLDELLVKSKPTAEKEVTSIINYAHSIGFEGVFMPWDWAYYTELYKAATYDLNDEMTRPYFQLERVQNAMFMLAERLYGLTFRENKEIPVYHSDVRVFEVFDGDNSTETSPNQPISILYLDYFPRSGKQGGAWMTTYRQACVEPTSGEIVIPVVSLVCNFTKPSQTRPALLSFNEVTPLFHEFGHGLHGMLGRGRYPSQTGTNVRRDFVELPSQILENWVSEKEFLDLWASHYESGEKMPDDLIDKIVSTKQYLVAYSCVRQLQFGLCDMSWHGITTPFDSSSREDHSGFVVDFERDATERTRLMPIVDGVCFSSSFGHIFSGGYAAGYYSYKWAEVLEADAYARFKAAGIFDRETAISFRDNILIPGGSEHPMDLFKRFAGGEPTVEPLLKKMNQ